MQTSAQYVTYTAMPAAMPYDMPYDMSFAGVGIPGGATYQTYTTYETMTPGLANQYMGAPAYATYGMPQYDLSMPSVMETMLPEAAPQAAPQATPQVPEVRQEIPHPDTVKREQDAYLQKAVENLNAQKAVEEQRREEEKKRIVEEIQAQSQKLLAAADTQHDERIKNLDASFNLYSERLNSQAQELRVQYYRQLAQARFDEAEKSIALLFQNYQGAVHLQDLEGLSKAQAQAQALRQENMQTLQNDLQSIMQGIIPAEYMDASPAPMQGYGDAVATPDEPPVAQVAEQGGASDPADEHLN